jgi:hypothetical protein
MTGMRVSHLRLGSVHVMSCMGIGGLAWHGRHVMTGVRIGGLFRLSSHIVAGMGILLRRGRRGVTRMLGKSRRGEGERGSAEGDEEGLHAGSPSSSIGRTLTTFIMPACMW